jgi:hypothetical protein
VLLAELNVSREREDGWLAMAAAGVTGPAALLKERSRRLLGTECG